MHINILEKHTGKGYGTHLMDKLTSNLKERSAKGLSLGVDIENERAISFYKKYGFAIIKKYDTWILMGLKFDY